MMKMMKIGRISFLRKVKMMNKPSIKRIKRYMWKNKIEISVLIMVTPIIIIFMTFMASGIMAITDHQLKEIDYIFEGEQVESTATVTGKYAKTSGFIWVWTNYYITIHCEEYNTELTYRVDGQTHSTILIGDEISVTVGLLDGEYYNIEVR